MKKEKQMEKTAPNENDSPEASGQGYIYFGIYTPFGNRTEGYPCL
jgi:hypothetical protein